MQNYKVSVEHYTGTQTGYYAECMEGDTPVDYPIEQSDLINWIKKNEYARLVSHDEMGERQERVMDAMDFLACPDTDMYVVLADYLNDTLGRTLPAPMRHRELPQDALLPTLAASHFMSTINRPQSKRA